MLFGIQLRSGRSYIGLNNILKVGFARPPADLRLGVWRAGRFRLARDELAGDIYHGCLSRGAAVEKPLRRRAYIRSHPVIALWIAP